MNTKEIREKATVGFKELNLNDGTKIIAYYANNKGRGSDNVSLYHVNENVTRAGNCKSQNEFDFIGFTRTSGYKGHVNLSNVVLSKLGL